jgi:hypothetical protein
MAERRGRDAQLRCGAGETPFPRDRKECDEVTKGFALDDENPSGVHADYSA